MRTFILALAALSAAALATPVMAQSDAMTYCKADIARLCAGIAPGGGKIIACLNAKRDQLSASCKTALDSQKKK